MVKIIEILFTSPNSTYFLFCLKQPSRRIETESLLSSVPPLRRLRPFFLLFCNFNYPNSHFSFLMFVSRFVASFSVFPFTLIFRPLFFLRLQFIFVDGQSADFAFEETREEKVEVEKN